MARADVDERLAEIRARLARMRREAGLGTALARASDAALLTARVIECETE